MNVALIYTVTVVLRNVLVGIYGLLVRPQSLGIGLAVGAFVGLALGVSAGLGTFVHMPIPPAVAWGWFVGGWLKGLERAPTHAGAWMTAAQALGEASALLIFG